MIENIEIAYCMAALENEIRGHHNRIGNYMEKAGYDNLVKAMYVAYDVKVAAFEIAFGVDYF